MDLQREHIPVILAMANPYDYVKFMQIVTEKQLMPISRNEYLEGVRKLLPNSKHTVPSSIQGKGAKRSCCGGGRSR